MDREHKNLKPLLLAAVAAVTVIAILLVFFFSGRKSAGSQTIVLPDPPAPDQQPEQTEQENGGLVSVSRDNVQEILQKSVSRPSSYHQSMEITITSGDVQRVQTAELWVQGGLVKVQVTDAFETKTVLADETTLYVWYDDEQPVKMARGAGMRTDNLAGVPTYEQILDVSKSQITQAAFVSLSELSSDCVYVSVQSGTVQQDYWVGLESGLLCKQTMTDGGELVYLMEQTGLEIFPDNDEALDGVFCLPDGTQAFSTEA